MISGRWLVGLCGLLAACHSDAKSSANPDETSKLDGGQTASDGSAASKDGNTAQPMVGPDGSIEPDAHTDPVGPGAAFVEGTTIRVGPISAAPSDEAVVCVVVDLGNEAPLYIRKLETHLNAGSHHMIVYRTEEAVAPVPTACGTDLADERMMFIAQSHEASLRYPDPAALVLQAHQHVKVEIHYFNDTAAKLDIGASIAFTPHVGDTAKLLPVKTRFTGELSVTVPPGPSTTESFISMPASHRYFALTTHTHRWGVRATLKRAANLGDPSPTQLHESLSWSEPPLTQLDPPITFDGDGVILTCNYDNLSSDTVHFGTSARDEMCFLWGYYY